MNPRRLCLYDFDHAHSVVLKLHEKVTEACHGEGVSVDDGILFRALGCLDAALSALSEARDNAKKEHLA